MSEVIKALQSIKDSAATEAQIKAAGSFAGAVLKDMQDQISEAKKNVNSTSSLATKSDVQHVSDKFLPTIQP